MNQLGIDTLEKRLLKVAIARDVIDDFLETEDASPGLYNITAIEGARLEAESVKLGSIVRRLSTLVLDAKSIQKDSAADASAQIAESQTPTQEQLSSNP